MTTTRQLTLGQEWFTERSRLIIGNQLDPDELDGACDGIAYIALVMFFSGDIDLDTFNNYMEWIHDTPSIDVSRMINDAKNQRIISLQNLKTKNNNESINKESALESDRLLKLIDIFIFFQNIHIIQNSVDHQDIFSSENKVITQQSESEILTLIEPLKLINKGGIKKISTFSGCYNKNELLDYFQSLKNSINKHTKPFMLILQTVMHAIAVGYNPDLGEWIIIDGNRLPAKKARTVNEITDSILLSFFDSNKAIFSTKIYTIGNDTQSLTEDIQEWMRSPIFQAIHLVTSEKSIIVDALGDSWLSLAAKTGCIKTVNELLRQTNINPNLIGRFSGTALKLATQEQFKEIIEAISLHSKTDVNLANDIDKTTPLNQAASFGLCDVVNFLLNQPKIDVNKTNNSGMSPLMWAALRGNLNIVVSLLDRPEINVNQSDSLGATALYLAAQNGHLNVVKALLKHPNIDVNLSLKNGSSPLYIASFKNYPHVVDELLKNHKINVNATLSNYNETSLCIATLKGNLEVVNELLKHPKINVNCVDCYGYTPLLIATEYGFTEIVKALIKNQSVDTNHTNQKGESSLTIAKKKNHNHIQELLNPKTNITSNNYSPKLYQKGVQVISEKDIIKDTVKLKKMHEPGERVYLSSVAKILAIGN